MRVVQAYKPEGLKYAWEILVVKPRGNSAVDWAKVATLEEEFVRFGRLALSYRDNRWMFRDETPLLASWREIERILEHYGLSLPSFQLDETYWLRREEEGEWLRKIHAAQRRNLRRLREATKTLEETLMPLRAVPLSAYRFVVRGTKTDNVLVWHYPTRTLRSLSFPLFEKGKWERFVEVWGELSEKDLRERLAEDGNKYHRASFFGWVDESTGIIKGRGTAYRKTTIEREEAELFKPYWFDAPYIRWEKGIAKSDVLPKSATDWISQIAHIVPRLVPLQMKGRNRDGLDLEMEMPPLVVVGWEDGGIWEEYDRIWYACDQGVRKEGLGTIEGVKAPTPVTEIYGAHSLIIWNWVSFKRQRAGTLLKDTTVCPICGHSSPRDPRQHRRRLCDNCASPGLKRVRTHRAKKKGSGH